MFFDPKDGDVIHGLEKVEAVLAFVHGFLFEIVNDPDTTWELDREAFKGAAYVTSEVRYAVREMLVVLMDEEWAGRIRKLEEKRQEDKKDGE